MPPTSADSSLRACPGADDPETVTPAGLYTEAWAATERHRTDDTHPLEAAGDGLDTAPFSGQLRRYSPAMDPRSAERPQQPRTFTRVLCHVARRPLLIAWLLALAVLAGVVQSRIRQPWSGLIYIVITPAAVVSITRSLDQADKPQDPTES